MLFGDQKKNPNFSKFAKTVCNFDKVLVQEIFCYLSHFLRDVYETYHLKQNLILVSRSFRKLVSTQSKIS